MDWLTSIFGGVGSIISDVATGIGDVVSSIGSSIFDGVEAIGGAVGSAFETVSGWISDGAKWLTGTVESFFGLGSSDSLLSTEGSGLMDAATATTESADILATGEGISTTTVQAAEKVVSTGESLAESVSGMDSVNLLARGGTGTGIDTSVTGQVAKEAASDLAATTGQQLTADAGAGGLLGAGGDKIRQTLVRTQQPAVESILSVQNKTRTIPDAGSGLPNGEGLFDNMKNLFSTDAGKGLSKIAISWMSQKYQNARSENALNWAERYAASQAEESRRDWLMEQQHASNLQSAEWQRENQQTLADRRNTYAGLTGKWYNPTSDVPMPTTNIDDLDQTGLQVA